MKTHFSASIPNTGYTLLADFTANEYDKATIQVLSVAAVDISFAWASDATEPAFVLPGDFTSLTTGHEALRTRKLYAKLASGDPATVYVNIW